MEFAKMAAAIGAALCVFGAAWGIGKIGKSAMEAIARQPESAGNIRTSMIIVAALVEGVSLFAVVVCLMAL
ncbi:MAG: ATP synthase F0 subunit C [Bacteroidales bacterium]|nr:ATP synthase F0 subunit C [Bacteroidales bacterium]